MEKAEVQLHSLDLFCDGGSYIDYLILYKTKYYYYMENEVNYYEARMDKIFGKGSMWQHCSFRFHKSNTFQYR